MNAQKWVVAAFAALTLSASGAALAEVNGTPSAPESEGEVTPYIIVGTNPGGNRTCAEVGSAFFGNATFYQCWTDKFNYPDDFPAVFTDISGNQDCDRNVIDVEVTTDGTFVRFESGPDVVGAALIKGSSDTNVYVYNPQAFSDSGLASPLNASGEPAGLSNIGGFCWNPDEPEGPPVGGCFEGETAWADGSRYVRRGNWATYTPYNGEEKTVDLFAGQTMLAGTVHFSAAVDGLVTITIALNEGWRFAMVPVGEEEGMPIFDNNVKIQHYESTPPNKNPAPGLFQWKSFWDGDVYDTATVVVPQASFYGVHVDVEREVECPE